MAINRVKSPYASGYFGPLYGPAAYAPDGGTISTFVATSANPNNVVGATYRVHEWDTAAGTFTITFTKAGYIDALVIGGGGAGGSGYNTSSGAGGGAGGLLVRYNFGVLAQSYTVVVGAGGPQIQATSGENQKGRNSSFGPLVAFGGGYGGAGATVIAGSPGGSSGGNRGDQTQLAPVISIEQGNIGGYSFNLNSSYGGGGGGAGGAAPIPTVGSRSADGGPGLAVAFDSNIAIHYCGGGAGGSATTTVGTPGIGGGGKGSPASNSNLDLSATFYGGGGGGGYSSDANFRGAGDGFRGLVAIRYRIS